LNQNRNPSTVPRRKPAEDETDEIIHGQACGSTATPFSKDTSPTLVESPGSHLHPEVSKAGGIFPKSRDPREEPGLRQLKTTSNSQTFPPARPFFDL